MKLTGAKVFSQDHKMHKKDLCFENGVITEYSASGELDVTGCYVLPGLIDTHIHGAKGISFYWSDDDITPALDWLTRQGVTGVLPTTACETLLELEQDLKRLATCNDERILGIHAEGPFINPANKGGMFSDRIQTPDCDTLQRIYDASMGRLKVITLAPEMKGATDVIKRCNQLGIKVSMGHTSSDYECAHNAVNIGATRLTHTFNAMRPFNHRDTGILGCALEDNRVMCELICDLFHVSEPAIRLVLGMKGPELVTMISDGSQYAGMPDGQYPRHNKTLYIKNGLCTLADGTISGSTRSLSDGARNLFNMGICPEDIAVMSAVNPAKLCKCTDRGELICGYRADITVFDKDFNVKHVFLKGQQIL